MFRISTPPVTESEEFQHSDVERSPDRRLQRVPEEPEPPWERAVKELSRRDMLEPFVRAIPYVASYYDDKINGFLKSCIVGAARLIVFTIYTFDNEYLDAVLTAAQKPGIELFLLFDHGQVKKPSSARQRVAMLKMKNVSNIYCRMRQPWSGVTSAVHMKSILVDMTVMITGSANFTHNSARKCDEVVVANRDAAMVIKHADTVWQKWSASKPIDWKFIEDAEARKKGKIKSQFDELVRMRMV